MKDRRISVNIRKLLDIMEYAKEEELEAVVLSLDFVKCFDKCSFSILHGSLDFFGFGHIVKDWTKILYKDFQVKIQNNGNFSSLFPINKGVHQGGCCSSIYFLVIAEILAMALRGDERIQGITIQQIKNILNQFADDADVFSMNNEQSIKAIFTQLEDFRKQSGFTISKEKTVLYRIGSLRHSNAKLYNIDQVAWSNEDINVLGVTIAHDNLISKNYDMLLQKVTRVLNSWENRGLTLIGRTLVVNTMVMSLFVYKMMVLPTIPEPIIKRIENEIRKYLWSGRKAKIAYKILQNPIEQGGLNLADLKVKDLALKATWPQILCQEEEYAQIAYYYIDKTLQEDIWRTHMLVEDVQHLKIQNKFWEDVVKSWCAFNHWHNFELSNQILWRNSRIRIEGKPFMWNKPYNKGLIYVYQLFENGTFKKPKQLNMEYELNIMQCNSLYASIPQEWKEYFFNLTIQSFLPITPSNFDRYKETRNLSSKVYKLLAGDWTILHNKIQKWNQKLSTSWDIEDFNTLFKEIKRITNYTKMRDFQYRLLQRGIVLNTHLYRWGKIDTNLCTFCTKEPETLEHIFTSCQEVRRLWDMLEDYSQQQYSIPITTNNVNIITNHFYFKKHVINTIGLFLKQYIYRQRCLKMPLNFTEFKKYINKIKNIERYIAIKNEKLSCHIRKWKGILRE